MPRVDLRTYRYFCAVAESGSVRIASEACSVTQPAISRQLALLEATLGVRLFQRRPSGMILTVAGNALYAEAVRLLSHAERAERSVSPWTDAGLAFRVACLDTTLHHILAPFVAETGSSIADLRPERAQDVYATLEENVDIGVSTASPPRGKQSELLVRIPISAQCAKGVLPTKFRGELADVSSYPIAIAGYGSAVEQVVRDAAEGLGIDLTISHVVSSGRMAQAAAASKRMIAITTEPSQFRLQVHQLVAGGSKLTVPLYAVWDTGHPADRKIRQLVQALSKWIAIREPWRPARQAVR